MPSAEAIAELKRLYRKNRSRLTEDSVIEAARDPANALHEYFEWDDEKAANAYRIEQARRLIRSSRFPREVDHIEIRSVAYIRDPRCGAREQGYVPIDALRARRAQALQALDNELQRVESSARRAQAILEALHPPRLDARIGEDIQAAIEAVKRARARLLADGGNPKPPPKRGSGPEQRPSL
jgi:hypothetical protein